MTSRSDCAECDKVRGGHRLYCDGCRRKRKLASGRRSYAGGGKVRRILGKESISDNVRGVRLLVVASGGDKESELVHGGLEDKEEAMDTLGLQDSRVREREVSLSLANAGGSSQEGLQDIQEHR